MKCFSACILGVIAIVASLVQADSFEEQIDLTPWSDQVAVFTDGRVKSFETFARSYMPFVMGSRTFDGQDASFTFFDMLIRPERYLNGAIIYVKHKGLRALIINEVDATDPATKQQLDQFMGSGLISREVLQLAKVRSLLNRLRQDVLRFAVPIETIDNAIGASDPRTMWASLKIVPPGSGSFQDPWSTLDSTTDPALIASWSNMVNAWQSGDAETVNTELVILSALLPQLAGGSGVYPSSKKLKLESVYFRLGNLTSIWLVYLVSLVLLLMAFVYRFATIGKIGIAVFVFAVSLHTVAVVWRWYVSGRFPNANMFEAVTTASWMGCLFACIMETLVRKKAMKYIFPIGAATAAMIAFLAVRLYPLELSPHISNKMPVLHDVWLYIHTNFVIFSYCLIFVAAIAACIYLVRRLVLKVRGQSGVNDYARAGGAGSLVEVRSHNASSSTTNMGVVLDGATMILVELSFIILWTGIVMGAIWADHSWGRPWGWDPKEVFALNTFFIFVILIHTRMKVQDKGLWTALFALIGCAVMLFNWIIINFTISGLHSYA